MNELLLLQKVSEGDWDAYTRLFNHYLPKLSSYIFPFTDHSCEDTEEVIQEVFLKIWEKREKLTVIRSFDSYLFRMAKNKLIDLINKRKSEKKLYVRYFSNRDSFDLQTEQSVIYSDYLSIAKKAIGELSPKLQKVFLMSAEQELSLDQISLELALPKETVKKRLYLANFFVRNYMRKNAEWMIFLAGCMLLLK
jgi:RNA polymerase sigma factor (sigma-70 family)